MSFHTPPAPLLLPSQRREIFELIRRSEFEARHFELRDAGQVDHIGEYAEIIHKPTRYYLRIRRGSFQGDSGWRVELSPAMETRVGSSAVGPWREIVLPGVDVWLELLARELDAGEDPWEQIAHQRELVAPELHTTENTPFAPEERAQISTQLREIKEYLRSTQSLSEASTAAIEDRLAYLEEAAGRMGRVDWRNAFVGVMLGLVVEAVAPPEVVREVLALALRGLSHLFGVPLPELPRA